MHIFGHAFGITANVNVTALGDNVPDLRCLYMDKDKKYKNHQTNSKIWYLD